MNVLPSLTLALACALPSLSFAQWQWIDKDGVKVYSDRSPPPDIPPNKILRQPGGKPVAAEPAAAPVAATAAPAAPRLSGKDASLEEKKRQAEAAEAAARKAEEEKVAAAKAENCGRARQSKASFDSGVRIQRTNAKGEREVLDDAARAAEVKRLEAIIAADCKK